MTGLNPLDWYGGAFLGLYAILFVAALLAGAVIASMMQPEGRSLPAANEDELAVLAGGTNRLAETVVARLLARGEASIEPDGVFVGQVSAGSSAVERELASLSSPVKWPAIQQRIAAAAARIEQQLVARELLLERGAARQLGLAAAVPLILLIGLGLAKVQVGVTRERPVGFLVAFLIVTAIAALLRVFATGRRTRAGIAALKGAQRSSERLRRAPTNDEAGAAVALFGTAVLMGSPMADLHAMRQGSADSGTGYTGSDGSWGGNSDGSSSGGDGGGSSGCGGGGCGGCGGGS